MSTTSRERYGGTMSATWLAERLAVDPSRIDAMRRAGELVAVREPGSTVWLYPTWQFDGNEPLHGIERVVRVAREAGLDETRLYTVLSAPLGLGGERRVYQLLREGRDDEVVEIVRAG